MLSCNGIVQNSAKELSVPPVMSYFLCDYWYVSEKIINAFAQKWFHTIGALKTNRLLYPSGMKKKLSELAGELSVTHNGFDLVTVNKRKYYVYRWSIEIFFRQYKDKMALDGYQLRSAQGIKRYWLLMSLAHFMCIAGTGEFCSFETGYHKICGIVQLEKYRYLFQCAKESDDFDSFIKLAG